MVAFFIYLLISLTSPTSGSTTKTVQEDTQVKAATTQPSTITTFGGTSTWGNGTD